MTQIKNSLSQWTMNVSTNIPPAFVALFTYLVVWTREMFRDCHWQQKRSNCSSHSECTSHSLLSAPSMCICIIVAKSYWNSTHTQMHTCEVKASHVSEKEGKESVCEKAGDKNATGDGERVVTERHLQLWAPLCLSACMCVWGFRLHYHTVRVRRPGVTGLEDRTKKPLWGQVNRTQTVISVLLLMKTNSSVLQHCGECGWNDIFLIVLFLFDVSLKICLNIFFCIQQGDK